LLLKAINLIRDRFNFYHASIFLIDTSEHNAVIREATGDAGAQLKRIGHKLAVGSKSIVGFVAGKGEPLVVNDIQKDATHLPNPMLPDTRAEAAIPLKIGERILGVLDVQSTIPYSFSSYDISIFQTLADQLAIAVSNSELFGEIQEHLSQHRLLHHITTSAASGTTLEEALTSAVKGLQVTLGGDRVSILLSDEERKRLMVKAWVGYSENASDMTIPFGSGITGWVAAHRKPLRVNDITQDARYILVSPNTRSELALPLIFRNDILGVLNVESEQIGAYNENDEEMLGTLAGSLAAIIANARLVDQIRKQAERERLLNEISSKIRRSTDMHTILTTTIQEIQRVTGVRKAQIDIGITTNEQEEFKTEPLKAGGE
jgi:GAF domain-containing protein